MQIVDGIFGFDGDYRFLSNFWVEPNCGILYDGLVYPSTEHAYQAAKTLNLEHRKVIRDAHSPGKAKRLGSKVELRDDWEDIKLDIMYDICRQKFCHPELHQKLLDTGDFYLEETNTWGDTYWGVCNGKGQNMLGLILMRIRKELAE